MMYADKEEIQRQLAHAELMLATYRENRRKVEAQLAQMGGRLDLTLSNQLDLQNEQISVYEREVVRLRTEVVTADLSEAEITYKLALAQAWNTSKGQPSVVASIALEQQRLRLGISVEHAAELERDTRVRLAHEGFYALPRESISFGFWARDDVVGPLLGRVVRLDLTTAVRLVTQYTSDVGRRDILRYKSDWLDASKVWPDTEDWQLFEQFAIELKEAFANQGNEGTSSET